LAAAVLFDRERFAVYTEEFPTAALWKAVDAYPMLSKPLLQTLQKKYLDIL
jgi:hypothetical protein